MNALKKNVEDLHNIIKKKRSKFFITSFLLTASLISLGVGSYYAKNTINSIFEYSIKNNDKKFVNIESQNNINDDEVKEIEGIFSKEDIYKRINLNLDFWVYKSNIVSDKNFHYLKVKILENYDSSLSFKYGSKPINDNEIALTDFAIRPFYEFGIKNIYNEVSSELIKENENNLIVIPSDFGNLKIKGIIDTGFDFNLYDDNQSYYEYENLVENSILFNENVTNKIKNYIRTDKKILSPLKGILQYDLDYNLLNSLYFIHESETYKDYIYKIDDKKDSENDIYLNSQALSRLINSIDTKNKEVVLPSKFNFDHKEINTNLKLSNFFNVIDNYILEYAATKYYEEAYSNKSFDIYRCETELNKEGTLSQSDKKDAYKLFLRDVDAFGIQYDEFFNNNPQYFKINECAKEMVGYLFNEYKELFELSNMKIKYVIKGEEKEKLNIRGINLTGWYSGPVSVVSKEFYDKLNLENDVYSSLHIKKDKVVSNFESFMKFLNDNKGLKIFNNEKLGDGLWLHENCYFIPEIIMFSLFEICLIAFLIIYFFDIKLMFTANKIKKDKNYKSIYLYSIGIASLSALVSLILLPLFTYLSNLIIYECIKPIQILISGRPGIEYLYLILGIILVSFVAFSLIGIFRNKTNKKIEASNEN